MSRNLSPQEYQRMIGLHKVIKKMSASEFVIWANRYYELAYNGGRDSTYKEIADNKDSIIVPDYVEAEIYEENGRVKIAVTGSFSGTKEMMENETAAWVYDLQENPHASRGSGWDGKWTVHMQKMTTTIGDGTFTVVIDVTDIGWTESGLAKQCYTFHMGRAGEGTDGQNPDIKLTCDLGNSNLIFNGKTYTLTSVRGSSSGLEFWGCLGLTIQ